MSGRCGVSLAAVLALLATAVIAVAAPATQPEAATTQAAFRMNPKLAAVPDNTRVRMNPSFVYHPDQFAALAGAKREPLSLHH